MRDLSTHATMVTTAGDKRITPVGRVLRKAKIDELPQFINVLMGHMSVVGPRPDVPGYADALRGDDRIVLSVRPGVTGPASICFRDEEVILASSSDPERFNDEVLWPAKVRMNVQYVRTYSFWEDMRMICDTVFPFLSLSEAARERHRLESCEGGPFAGMRSTPRV